MFFSFQLALPKTSVLLLCQRNSRFLTFFILLFAPLPLSFAFGTFRSLPFGSLLVVFLFSVVSFAVFWGQYSLFFNVCLFQQPFSYLFYIAFSLCFFPFAFETFCPLPFPLLLKHFALCPLEVCPLFSYSRLFHSLSFGGSTRSFSMSVCFNSDFLTFFILFFALCPFPLLLGHFTLCPLEVYSFFYSMLYHSLSFGGSTRSFSMPVCFNSRFLTFFILFFALCLLPFAFGTFRPLPFSILQTAFCPLLPPFCCFLSFLCVEFTFCVTFDGNLLQKFVTRQKV